MTAEPDIRVGLITDGPPRLKIDGELTEVGNLLIGHTFHWQQSIPVRIAGTTKPLIPPQGNIYVVNTLPLEDYLESVTASEMNPKAPLEFLKAHAVISRSWAMRKLSGDNRGLSDGKKMTGDVVIDWEESDAHKGFDVCSDDHCQRYQGTTPARSGNAIEAVRQTRGVVLTSATDNGEEIIDARFSKCCGGRTELFSSCWADKDFPYLPAQTDKWCDLSAMSRGGLEEFAGTVFKGYDRDAGSITKWTHDVPADEIRENIIKRYGIDLGDILHLDPISRGASGRMTRLEVKGSRGSLTVGKELPIRRILARDCLRSSWFDIEEREGSFRLRGRGWGHGVGLCQTGAARMAQEDRNHEEILRFYYPGAKLTKLYD